MSQTNLVTKDYLLQVLERCEYIFSSLLRPKLSHGILDLAGEESAMSMEGGSAILFQLISAPPFRHVAQWRCGKHRIQLSYM